MPLSALIVEDEPALSLAIEDALMAEGLAVQCAATLAVADDVCAGLTPDVTVLDRMLPDGDGLVWLQRRRSGGWKAPVLILSARAGEEDRCDGLEGGADDYLAKPFSPRELRARVSALLRRRRATTAVLELAGHRVDLSARHGPGGDLSEQEHKLLSHLAEHLGEVCSRDDLLRDVWGFSGGTACNSRAVDMCVTGLRRKLGDGADALVTVRGGGYRLDGEMV